jgi:hypothetical protein
VRGQNLLYRFAATICRFRPSGRFIFGFAVETVFAQRGG